MQWKEVALSDIKSVWVHIEVFKPMNQYIDDIPPEIPQLNCRAVVEIIRACSSVLQLALSKIDLYSFFASQHM